MIAVFAVRTNFSYSEEKDRVIENCLLFTNAFPEGEASEFFYYLLPSDPERYFIIRTNTKNKTTFTKIAGFFAENMNFPIVSSAESKLVLMRMKLDEFY